MIIFGFKPQSLRWTRKHPISLVSVSPGCHARHEAAAGQAVLAALVVVHTSRDKSSVLSIYIFGWKQEMDVSPRQREGSAACGKIYSPLIARHALFSQHVCLKLKMFLR